MEIKELNELDIQPNRNRLTDTGNKLHVTAGRWKGRGAIWGSGQR